ncbi:MAG: hypothetical protein LQ340_000621 [Diploschistes diacapsis]|nr:MAG: hypothetical protein LQ340_000621 [Diploschistes diacapsis]
MNFPTHRGTATAFPLAAFGLSAFFFSSVAGAISTEADEFLLVVSIGTITMTTVPCLLLRTTHLPTLYTTVPTEAPRATRPDSHSTLKSKPLGLSKKRESLGSGTQCATVDGIASSSSSIHDRSIERVGSNSDKDPKDNFAPRLGNANDSAQETPEYQPPTHHSLYADVRGFAMLKYSECYELFVLIGLLTGIGLMTIK